jgi:MtN3 and saliva related transmembrane protein
MELEILAFIGSALGICATLPQIIKILKTGRTGAISYVQYIMFIVSSIIWVTYGLNATVYSIVFWNSIGMLLSVSVLMLKFRNEQFNTQAA